MAIATAIPAYYQWMEHRFKIELVRFKETKTIPDLLSDWSVRIVRTNKVISFATAFCDGGQLNWAGTINNSWVRRLGISESGVVRILKGNDGDNVMFEIKDGRKTVFKRRYGKIPLDRQYF